MDSNKAEAPALNKKGNGEEQTCSKCYSYLFHTRSDETKKPLQHPDKCQICLGLWDTSSLQDHLKVAISEACDPYGGVVNNYFSQRFQQASIAIPGDVYLRYELKSETSSTCVGTFIQHLKEHVKHVLADCIPTKIPTTEDAPTSVRDEEQGYLGVHVVLTPPIGARPPCFNLSRPRQRKRKHFGDPSEKRQGGDAISNLEERLRKSVPLWSTTDVQNTMGKATPLVLSECKDWLSKQEAVSYNLHVAVWRRAIYVRGLYTKCRRDVSQTPFYVPTTVTEQDGSTKKAMKRLGVSSVDEEISPVLERYCGGISELNNVLNQNNMVYGMVKFHASGREDMDVRMLLPPTKDVKATGRPFCCEIIDAFRMPTEIDLQSAEDKINCIETAKAAKEGFPSDRSYGNNPNGVGVRALALAPSTAYRNLQAETEEKVKHYGCICWCEKPFSKEEIENLLHDKYPLLLNQQTPIRVLHRRSNSVRQRNIRSLQVNWFNEHWFQLHLSTDAGTYVKEFVHGDLGRTVPSVATLLGCKTDILQLDCEGIEGVGFD